MTDNGHRIGRMRIGEITPAPAWITVPHPEERFTLLSLTWDITAAWEIIAAGSADREVVEVPVASAASMLGLIWHDLGWALQHADLSRPVLLVTLPNDGGTMLIDGWHRIARADAEGVECLPGYMLTAEEEQKIRR